VQDLVTFVVKKNIVNERTLDVSFFSTTERTMQTRQTQSVLKVIGAKGGSPNDSIRQSMPAAEKK